MNNTSSERTIFSEQAQNQQVVTGLGIKESFPQSVLLVFLFFGLYIALPLIDVPLLGLSLSAPVFFLVALPAFFRPPQPWLASYRRWILAAILIWLGIFLSAMLNGLVSGGVRVDSSTFTSLVQFAYWLLVFAVTVYLLSSQPGWFEYMALVLAAGIALLGFLRLGEAVLWGAVGSGARLRLITQNGYGIQFSTFFPLLFSLAYFGKHRTLAAFGALVTVLAILINGSRSNWLAALASSLVLLWMLLRTQRQRIRSVVILFLLAGGLGVGVLFAPQVVAEAFEQRLASFQTLQWDKSYAIRQLMVQKGLRLFRSSPLIGVGVSRWRKESLPLEIPPALRYAPQSYFDAKSSHNSYVSFLAENGLTGAIPYAVLLLMLAVRGYGAAGRLARRGQVWALGVYAGFVGMSIHLWSLSGLTSTLAWFVYGMVGALIVLERRTRPQVGNDASRLPLPRPRPS